MFTSPVKTPLSSVPLKLRTARRYSVAASVARTVKQVEDAMLGSQSPRRPRAEGTIASVFASLSGEKAVALPDRFIDLKRELLHSPDLQNAARAAWTDLCQHLSVKTREIADAGNSIIPEVEYKDIANGLAPSLFEKIRASGTLVVRGVVPEQKALEWLEHIKRYIAQNPQVKGFPEDDKAVYELYWSKAQLEARSCSSSLDVQRFLLSLFNKNSTSNADVSFSAPLTYCDRLRIRRPGDSRFALGAHVDGGSVERWEDPTYRSSYKSILEGRWREHDAWDIGGRPTANQNLYDGPGACGIFRAFQGWTSLSSTGPSEGTLKVFPAIKESTAYIILRPFFKANQPRISLPEKAYLDPANWSLDLDSPTFPGSPLGRSQELNDETHPHLCLKETLLPMKPVKPGDQVWWHCDGIHAVESEHKGANASSVLYIPSVPLTEANARYIMDQRDNSYLGRIPPPDFPGGEGEKFFEGTGGDADIVTEQGKQAMGLAPLSLEGVDASERLLRQTA
ncbi:hypothetical protein QFC21_000991 [Naganishia friedmannii]|uniref:Uncharacterized protein n=1 Tax=Naganishia friedmannii TaxID=89922 RepID=A0ACC2W8K3_9TREE|nr:hypothetical protein QFC21_000991 [Naganishia friedmannii]